MRSLVPARNPPEKEHPLTRYTLTVPATLNDGALVPLDDIGVIEDKLLRASRRIHPHARIRRMA